MGRHRRKDGQVARLQAGIHVPMVVFARRDDLIVHITEVPNGYQCEAHCLACGEPLNAKNRGRDVAAHFAHRPGQVCTHALESSIHAAAAQVIAAAGWLQLPALYIRSERQAGSDEILHAERLWPRKKLQFDQAVLEATDYLTKFGFKPDVLAYVKEHPLAIEVFFRHRVDDEKRRRVKAAQVAMVELDVSRLTYDQLKKPDRFATYVLKESPRQWIFHPRYATLKAEADAELEAKYLAYLEQEKAAERARLAAAIEQEKREESERKRQRLQQERKQQEEQQRQAREKELRQLADQVYKNKEREQQQWINAASAIGERLYALGVLADTVPHYLNVVIVNDWIIATHRADWQSALFLHFIKDEDQQHPFFTIDAAVDYVESQFTIDPLAHELVDVLRYSYISRSLNSALGPYCGDVKHTIETYIGSLVSEGFIAKDNYRYRVLFRSMQDMQREKQRAERYMR